MNGKYPWIRHGAPLRRAVQRFWSWWSSELVALLPEQLRNSVRGGKQRVFVELEGTDLLVAQGTAENSAVIARHSLESSGSDSSVERRPAHGYSGEIILSLPADRALTKTVTLPLATEENLREVLAFEMDRQTPFSSDQVYYDFTVVTRNASAGTITLDLVVAPRKQLDALLAQLARLGLVPNVITTKNDIGARYPVNLLPAPLRARRDATPRTINLVLGFLTTVLLVVSVALPIWDKHRLVQTLEPMLETARTRAQRASELQHKIEQLTSEARLLVEKKQAALSALQVLNEVTRIFPDDTWLNRMDISNGEIQLHGQSSSAAALIPLIESSQLLENARFRSPVTRLPNAELERFQLSADIVEKSG